MMDYSGVKRTRGISWTDDETLLLLGLWKFHSKLNEQMDDSNNYNNYTLYKRIAESMREHGYDKTGEQCKVKVHTLKRTYRLNKKGLTRSVNKHFEKLDEILGSGSSAEYSIDNVELAVYDNRKRKHVDSGSEDLEGSREESLNLDIKQEIDVLEDYMRGAVVDGAGMRGAVLDGAASVEVTGVKAVVEEGVAESAGIRGSIRERAGMRGVVEGTDTGGYITDTMKGEGGVEYNTGRGGVLVTDNNIHQAETTQLGSAAKTIYEISPTQAQPQPVTKPHHQPFTVGLNSEKDIMSHNVQSLIDNFSLNKDKVSQNVQTIVDNFSLNKDKVPQNVPITGGSFSSNKDKVSQDLQKIEGNFVSNKDRVPQNVQTIEDKRIEIERQKIDAELKRIELDKLRLEFEERQRREDRQHQHRMLEILLDCLKQTGQSGGVGQEQQSYQAANHPIGSNWRDSVGQLVVQHVGHALNQSFTHNVGHAFAQNVGQSLNQSVTGSNNVGQDLNQSVHQHADQELNTAVTQRENQVINQSVPQNVGQEMSQSVTQHVGQVLNQSVTPHVSQVLNKSVTQRAFQTLDPAGIPAEQSPVQNIKW